MYGDKKDNEGVKSIFLFFSGFCSGIVKFIRGSNGAKMARGECGCEGGAKLGGSAAMCGECGTGCG